MNLTSEHIAQLEAENRELKKQLEQSLELARQNEQKLISEKERLQALGDNLPEGVLFRYTTDLAGTYRCFEYLSANWEKIFGISSKDTLENIQTLFSRVHPADIPGLEAGMQVSKDLLNNLAIEARYLHPDGSTRWFQVSSHPHPEGNEVVTDGVILDITTRKVAEMALLSEKNRLQALGDNFPNGCLFRFQIDDLHLRQPGAEQTWLNHLYLTYASASWEKLSNVPLSSAMLDVSIPFMKIHPDDLAGILPVMYRNLLELNDLNADIRYRYDENHIKWIQISSRQRLENGTVVCDGFILDITERKLVENELLEEKERLQALGDNFPNGALFRCVVDAETINMKLDYVSSTWDKVFGIPADVCMSDIRVLLANVSEEDRARFLEAVAYSAKTLNNVDIELRYRYPGGKEKWLHISSHPHREGSTIYSDGFVLDITRRKHIERELMYEKERLQSLGDHFPNGTLFRFRLEKKQLMQPDSIHTWMTRLQLSYASATWEEISNIPIAEAMKNALLPFMKIHPDDLAQIIPVMYNNMHSLTTFNVEVRYAFAENDPRWLQVAAHPRLEGEWIMIDGFILDITDRKMIETELAVYREELELLVKKRTEELETTNEELAAANEELGATNEEFAATNEELNRKNNQLEQYRTKLEQMVEIKTEQQSILFKILQSAQSAESIGEALNPALDIIGRYARVSRVYIFEKAVNGKTASNTYEWCNEGVDPEKGRLQNIPISAMQEWFDLFEDGGYINTSDIRNLSPTAYNLLAQQNIKSILVLPLETNGVSYGFVGFDECTCNREWQQRELDLLISLSQIISNSIRRFRAEKSMLLSQQTMRTVLDNIDANIYVADFDTYKVLFANRKIKETIGDIEGVECWKVLQEGQTGPCDFCPKPHLRDHNNNPTGLYHWEQWKSCNKKWYDSTDAAIEWIDGRLVHMQYATDITRRKMGEIELIRAKEKAEESDKLKSAFLANMSHEIRTPLNGIVGFINFLSAEDLPPMRREEYMRIITSSSDQLVKLIDDIVDVAKIEARQMNICPVPCNINNLMEEVMIFFESYLQTNGKQRVAMVLDNLKFIDQCITYIDPMRLRQVLNNLIGNAVKFTDKGYIRFGYKRIAPGMLQFVVEDSGIGIAPGQQEVIFERFRQAEPGNNRRYGGTGLGLTISRSLVQMMGGELHVESIEGIGSSFYFTIAYLPIEPADEHFFWNLPGDEPSPEKPLADKTVLVVEPGIVRYKYYEQLLSVMGATVVHAAGLQQCHDYITSSEHVNAIMAHASAFEGVDSDALRYCQSIRAGLPLLLLVPKANGDEPHPAIRSSQCNLAIDEPVNYHELLRAMEELRID